MTGVQTCALPISQEAPLSALRLEALPDDSLPARGPGRAYYEGRKGDFFLSELTATLDAAAEMELLREAEVRVQLRVKSHTWEAYRRTVLNSEPAAEVARQLNLPVADVYVAKSRVLKCLREEVARLSEAP